MMKTTNKIPLFCFLIACFCLTLTVVLQRCKSSPEAIHVVKTDTVTILHKDTIYDTITLVKSNPVPVKKIITRTDTIYRDTVLTTERTLYRDTIQTSLDTVCVETELEGINARMNYLKVQLKKGTVTNTITKTVLRKKGGLRFAPNVSLGYGLINRKPDIYVGFGITYEF